MRLPLPRRLAATTTAVVAAVVLAPAGPALAHVGVDPDRAERGGYATLDFTVPNERDNASTVKLEIALPADHPLASVMPQPVPGWDVKVTEAELAEPLEIHGRELNEAPSRITWSGGSIEPGTFQQFPVSVGRLPEDVDRLVFKAVQTYDNGEVVRWIEEPGEDGGEPESPAPVLELTAPGEDEDGHGTSGGAGDGTAVAAEAADGARGGGDGREPGNGGEPGNAAAVSGSDTTARVLAVIGITAGVGGIAFGVLAGRRRTA